MATRVIGLVAGFALLGGVASAGSLNGSAGAMPAFYDGTLFSINFKELPAGGGGATPPPKRAVKTNYTCDPREGARPPRHTVRPPHDPRPRGGLTPPPLA